MARWTSLMTAAMAAAAVSVSAPAVVRAQIPLKFSLGGGVTAPTGDVGDITNTGWHARGMMTLSAVLIPLSVRGEIEYHNMELNNLGFDHGDLSILGGGVSLAWTFPLPSRVRPYLLGGVGVYRVRASVHEGPPPPDRLSPGAPLLSADVIGESGEDDSETKFGFSGGAGLDVWLGGGVSLFVEGRYLGVNTSGSRTSIVPISIGFTFRG
ncbi:MAG TPA: outer membrane beta-barrel protein [Gemmatimonadaceae bacterium]|nr:outer membrane beta-barrel protein [Gemmatimonadaceae bacterium]